MTAERRRPDYYLLNVFLVVLGLAIVTPFFWFFINSLASSDQTFTTPPTWWPDDMSITNYREVFDALPFGTQILNSVKITGIAVVGSLVVSCLAAYAFARIEFRGRNALFLVLLTAMMIPAPVMTVPVFVVMRELGLLNTHASLWLPALIQVFSIFLLRQHFMAIPKELEEAAIMDGAGRLRILVTMFIPMSGSVISALAILIATTYWNDFMSPSVFLVSPDKMTIPVGLVQLQNAFGSAPTLNVFAGITLVVAPLFVLFLIVQPYLTKGVAMQGISR
ncbi:MAG TPA: carbohydrate ABC transporter permease [Mycobacteriales bacterium]|nr:carbohydrate ABC transporter permease [Mycobacteriales bacterium]